MTSVGDLQLQLQQQQLAVRGCALSATVFTAYLAVELPLSGAVPAHWPRQQWGTCPPTLDFQQFNF